MSTAPQANYLLVDGALRPNAMGALYRRGEALDIWPIYHGTRWREIREQGPILVAVAQSSSLISETYQAQAHRPDASLLYSTAPVDAVVRHLQRFIAPADLRSPPALLRFADPLVTLHWLSSYQGTHRDALLGPIEAWHVPEHAHTWAPVSPTAWQSFTRQGPVPEWDEASTAMGPAQHAALDRAGRWGLKERLYRVLENNHPQHLAQIEQDHLTHWFDERLDEAQAWGLTSARGHAIWIEYSLRWGLGFTQQDDGPYQQWLAYTPEVLGLDPDRHIKQLDNDCLIVNPNKDLP